MITPSMASKLLSAFTFSAAMATRNEEGGFTTTSRHLVVAEGETPPRAPRDIGFVRDEDHGDAGSVQSLEHSDDLHTGAGVESASRLIGENDMRIVDESPGDRDALLLTSGQLLGMVRRAMRKSDRGEALYGAPAYVGHGAGGNRAEGSSTLSIALVRASRLNC